MRAKIKFRAAGQEAEYDNAGLHYRFLLFLSRRVRRKCSVSRYGITIILSWRCSVSPRPIPLSIYEPSRLLIKSAPPKFAQDDDGCQERRDRTRSRRVSPRQWKRLEENFVLSDANRSAVKKERYCPPMNPTNSESSANADPYVEWSCARALQLLRRKSSGYKMFSALESYERLPSHIETWEGRSSEGAKNLVRSLCRKFFYCGEPREKMEKLHEKISLSPSEIIIPLGALMYLIRVNRDTPIILSAWRARRRTNPKRSILA